MMRLHVLLILFFPVTVLSQLIDDFSDGDFPTEPAWFGNTGHFRISSSSAVPAWHRPALQLNAPESGASCLAAANRLIDRTRWEFWIKLSFNSSANNFARVYLVSDNEDLSSHLQGYYIQFGGPEDSVCFFRQDSLTANLLFVLPGLFCGNSTNAFRLMVLRDSTGKWHFYSDPQGGELLLPCGEVLDNNYVETAFFGLFCQYTQSNITKIYFDEVKVAPYTPDLQPPVLLSAEVLGPSAVKLQFNEPLRPEEATKISNYLGSGGLGKPYAAVQLSDPEWIMLFFDIEMIPGESYTILVENLKDIYGNTLEKSSISLVYYPLRPFELIVTEVMADPNPPSGLPAFEYLELFNRTDHSLWLAGCTLVISGQAYELQPFSLLPGNYIIITSYEAQPFFTSYGATVALSSLTIPNEGGTISILDSAGHNLFYMEYDKNYYNDKVKSEGGWSLEMGDPDHPCAGAENWKASVSPNGGTPGEVNSTFQSLMHRVNIISACTSGTNTVDILFNTFMDSLSLVNVYFYNADKMLGMPSAAQCMGMGNNMVRLDFDHSLLAGELYTLSVSEDIAFCTGDHAGNRSEAVFGLPGICDPFNVVINEVLFNPIGDGIDFVEILNVSEKVVDAADIYLCSVHDRFPAPPDTERVFLSERCLPLLPGDYLCLTANPNKLAEQYYCPFQNRIIRLEPFPSMNNDAGTVLLTDNDGLLIDRMDYDEEMQFPLLNTSEGVSLEKIFPREPGTRRDNWHSASSFSGFGTPGYANSQYRGDNPPQEEPVWLSGDVFSPDGDGKDDVLSITCCFSSPGMLGSVLIFDQRGRLVRILVDNSLFGLQNTFAWDGASDGNAMVSSGLYVILVEAISMDGKTYRYKKAVGLAR